jgi:hypothetical protein
MKIDVFFPSKQIVSLFCNGVSSINFFQINTTLIFLEFNEFLIYKIK